VPTPVDYDDGDIGEMLIGKGNRSTWRKPAPVPHCPPQTPHAVPDANPGRRGGKPETNCLSHNMASDTHKYTLNPTGVWYNLSHYLSRKK
jgi:hypothetical protein